MDKRKIVIVGGVAGGASAATRARRMNESAEIVLFEKERTRFFRQLWTSLSHWRRN